MKENSKHRLENINYPEKEESQFVVPREKQNLCDELEELGPLFNAIISSPQQPSWAQTEKARNQLMDKIKSSRGDLRTTIKERLLATDSLLCRCLLYISLVLALAALAVSAFFIFQQLTASTAEAIEVTQGFLS